MNNESQKTWLEKILALLKAILQLFTNMSLSEFSRTKLDTDFTDDTICPDDVSCAFAVTTILQQFFQLRGIRFPIILGTDLLADELARSVYFERIYLKDGDKLPPNTVIVSPRTKEKNGHTGIVDDDGLVMNNNSFSGLWRKNYNRETWRETFVVGRGLETQLYQVSI